MKNIVIIGGGPAGYPAALKAASLGAKVVLIEKNKLGGVCLNCGCIPSKSLLDAGHRFLTARNAAALCADGTAPFAGKPDWQKIKARREAVTRKLTQGIGILLKKAGVEVVFGEGTLADKHTVLVHTDEGDKTFPADGIILAAGSEAFFPPPFDALKDQIYDNSTIFDMSDLPKTVTVVGGGVIGCEMADALNALSVEVNIVEMQPRILPLEEESAARVVFQALTKRGVKFYLGLNATAVEKTPEGFKMTLSDGQVLMSEAVLAAIGRSVDLSALGLDKIGVEWNRKGVRVNPETLQLKDNIYAAGDITGLFQLAHAATRQGEVAAANLCGTPAVYHNDRVPRAVYTSPEIAAVGLTKVQAEAKGLAVKTHKTFFLANGRAAAQEQTEGFVELVSGAQDGRLLGGTIASANAAELVHVLGVALAAEMTVEQLREVIFAHPTFAESIGEAAAK